MKSRGSILAFALGFAGSAQAASAATLVVDDDRAQCPSAAYTSIQAAADAAPAGSTIRVCPGTYAEQVVLTQAVRIRGDNGAIVRPAGVTTNSTSLFDGSPVAGIVVVADASGVAVEGLTIDGSASGLLGCAPNLVGVFFRNASGRLAASAVRNVQLGPGLEGCQSGTGVLVQSGAGGTSQVEIAGNNVHHFQKNGITANEVGTSVRVRGNTVMGRGPGPGAAQNGIQIGFGATGQILENVAGNHVWPGCVSVDDCAASAADVLVVEADGVRISGNTLGKSQGAVVVLANNAVVQGNKVYDTDVFDGIAVLGNGNRVLANGIARSDESAVFVAGDGNAVLNNVVNEAAIGVWTFSGTGNVVARNTFVNVPVPTLDGAAPRPAAARNAGLARARALAAGGSR